MPSWKTTTLGIVGLLTVVLNIAQSVLNGHPLAGFDWPTVIASLTTSVGLIFAKDHVDVPPAK